MSGDQLAARRRNLHFHVLPGIPVSAVILLLTLGPPSFSFGDPNAQPPTPRQTPTSIAFPSPDFETPKQFQKTPFDDEHPRSSSWTPRFAQDISVYNSSGPANAHRHFTAYTPISTTGTPSTSSSNSSNSVTSTNSTTTAAATKPATRPRIPSILLNRPLSAGDIAAHIASHATHFSPNPNLPTVDPSFRLPSSPLPLSSISREWSPELDDNDNQFQERARKKLRRGTITARPNSASCQQQHPSQTATPPPSARKADRKLAADCTATTMQDDQGYGQQDFLGTATTPQQHHGDLTAAFAASGHDIFGYPMSAPAGAPASFWDPSVSMTAMDLDFAAQAAASGILFQTPTQAHRGLEPYDWNSNAALFQDNTPTGPTANNTRSNEIPQSSNQENVQPSSKKGRALAPKPSASSAEIPVTSELAGAYSMAGAENPFTLSPSGGVDPGLLFSRPPSSSMDASFNPVSQPESSAPTLADPAPVAPSSAGPDPLQRSFSYKEPTRRGRREPASSPIKPTNPRAGLQRSFSESRGKRQLPALAPATMRQASQGSSSGMTSARPSSSRQSGRISPLKLHHRLTSLSSIPESNRPRTRTSVKFTIDARGRAHAETTTVIDEPSPIRRTSRDSGSSRRDRFLAQSESDDSATDDEPIIIPSRNASFALPDPRKPVGSIFSSNSSSRKKKSARVRASFSFDGRGMSPGEESEAETVLDSRSDREGSAGDAASELRKVVEDRQSKRVASQRAQRLASSSSKGGFEWGGASLLSPTQLTDTIPTPSTGGRRFVIRCICHRNDQGGATDTFMVQCEACEMWLHGRCINITRREMPPVYICAFCANTPNMRGGRLRDTGRAGGGNVVMGGGMPASGHGHGTSPLAHKSFKSFR
ncbi:hypothetical protein jhhlp_001192 [Lomentospora prolificans]|uniref:PHD-type domain-containing protein n=1 Tax=Lomentospora prolificans TaxID=41688 RepID=A0A2N3NHJ4_9PEZI|nr:hypothetical protein jhhlp_001192 [Lomentospora prolificans]